MGGVYPPSQLDGLREHRKLSQLDPVHRETWSKQFWCILSVTERLWLKENYYILSRNHARNIYVYCWQGVHMHHKHLVWLRHYSSTQSIAVHARTTVIPQERPRSCICHSLTVVPANPNTPVMPLLLIPSLWCYHYFQFHSYGITAKSNPITVQSL